MSRNLCWGLSFAVGVALANQPACFAPCPELPLADFPVGTFAVFGPDSDVESVGDLVILETKVQLTISLRDGSLVDVVYERSGPIVQN